MKVLKIFILTVALGIVGYLLFIFFHVFSPEIYNFTHRTSFDSEKWIAWEETIKEPSLRWHMVKNLTKENELVGMSIREVKELLGQPSSENNNFISYYLGMSGHGIDTGTLYLTIKDGIVIEYKIWHG